MQDTQQDPEVPHDDHVVVPEEGTAPRRREMKRIAPVLSPSHYYTDPDYYRVVDDSEGTCSTQSVNGGRWYWFRWFEDGEELQPHEQWWMDYDATLPVDPEDATLPLSPAQHRNMQTGWSTAMVRKILLEHFAVLLGGSNCRVIQWIFFLNQVCTV